MQPFATDIDLLHWEPNILNDAATVAQTLVSGTCTLASTTLTADAGAISFLDANISAEHAVVLAAPVAGSFPVVSVESANSLTLSVLYDDLNPDGDVVGGGGGGGAGGVPLSPGAGTGLSFWIRTFWPQRRVVSERLLQACGLDLSTASSIVDPSSLRRPCVLGTLQMIYIALAAASADPTNFLTRADLYERLYRRSLRAASVELDLDGDGEADTSRMLSVLELKRS